MVAGRELRLSLDESSSARTVWMQGGHTILSSCIHLQFFTAFPSAHLHATLHKRASLTDSDCASLHFFSLFPFLTFLFTGLKRRLRAKSQAPSPQSSLFPIRDPHYRPSPPIAHLPRRRTFVSSRLFLTGPVSSRLPFTHHTTPRLTSPHLFSPKPEPPPAF